MFSYWSREGRAYYLLAQQCLKRDYYCGIVKHSIQVGTERVYQVYNTLSEGKTNNYETVMQGIKVKETVPGSVPSSAAPSEA